MGFIRIAGDMIPRRRISLHVAHTVRGCWTNDDYLVLDKWMDGWRWESALGKAVDLANSIIKPRFWFLKIKWKRFIFRSVGPCEGGRLG